MHWLRTDKASLSILIFLLLSLTCYWSYFTLIHPLTFWGVEEDSTIMALAQAINIDFWLVAKESRSLSIAQFYQPGLPFQFLCWVIYRLSAAHIFANPIVLFKDVMNDPKHFWFIAQCMPLLLSSGALVVIWQQSRSLSRITSFCALAIFFTSISASHFGVFMLWNESFPFILAALFFLFVQRLLESDNPPDGKPAMLWLIATALFGGFLYMQKLNYIIWGLAFIPAFALKNHLNQVNLSKNILRNLLYFIFLILSVWLLGNLLLGQSGFKLMIESHIGIFLGNGIYGGGDKTIVKASVVFENLIRFSQEDPFCAALNCLFLILFIFVVFENRNTKDWLLKNLPIGTFLFTANSLMTLAILKHFQLHYTVAIAASFPLWILWFSRAVKRNFLPLIAPIILAAIVINFNKQMTLRNEAMAKQELALADEAEILKMPLKKTEMRLWMFQSIVPSFQRLFVLEYAGLPKLHLELEKIQGNQWMISPWQTNILTNQGFQDVKSVKWRYIVIPKTTFDNKWMGQRYSWLDDPSIKKVQLRQSTLFEKITE